MAIYISEYKGAGEKNFRNALSFREKFPVVVFRLLN